jgi:hypothetical protein
MSAFISLQMEASSDRPKYAYPDFTICPVLAFLITLLKPGIAKYPMNTEITSICRRTCSAGIELCSVYNGRSFL